jgi:hypothetical protein
MEISRATNEKEVHSEVNSKTKPNNSTKHGTSTVKMEGAAYSSRGRNRPRMA